MSDIERLKARVEKLRSKAVREVRELVEETARTQREDQSNGTTILAQYLCPEKLKLPLVLQQDCV